MYNCLKYGLFLFSFSTPIPLPLSVTATLTQGSATAKIVRGILNISDAKAIGDLSLKSVVIEGKPWNDVR